MQIPIARGNCIDNCCGGPDLGASQARRQRGGFLLWRHKNGGFPLMKQ